MTTIYSLTIDLFFLTWGLTDLRCVVAEPVVGLSEVIKDDAAAVASTGWQDNRWRGVGFAGHPGRVEGVRDEEESHYQNHPTGNLVGLHRARQHALIFIITTLYLGSGRLKPGTGPLNG